METYEIKAVAEFEQKRKELNCTPFTKPTYKDGFLDGFDFSKSVQDELRKKYDRDAFFNYLEKEHHEGTSEIFGEQYKTTVINGKTWLAENLRLTTDEISFGIEVDDEQLGSWIFNNNKETYGKFLNKLGLLYNWYAVKFMEDNKATLFPGWHVATNQDWDDLVEYVGGEDVAGEKLKSLDAWPVNEGMKDEYSFSAFPAGFRNSSGSFVSLGSNAYFWTATESSSSYAHNRYLRTGASMHSHTYSKSSGYSVRLVKDS